MRLPCTGTAQGVAAGACSELRLQHAHVCEAWFLLSPGSCSCRYLLQHGSRLGSRRAQQVHLPQNPCFDCCAGTWPSKEGVICYAVVMRPLAGLQASNLHDMTPIKARSSQKSIRAAGVYSMLVAILMHELNRGQLKDLEIVLGQTCFNACSHGKDT
eukprot:1159127-Pelagomonas_calceolata.AAC.6